VSARALLLILALLQATGIMEAMRRDACASECRDDGCADDCTPGSDSPSCACHCPSLQTHAPPTLAVVTLPAPTEATPVVFDGGDPAHTSPDPREILHVPRHAVRLA
jgi:hypothetical protein